MRSLPRKHSAPNSSPGTAGFTLMELLVVISVILILVSVTVASVNYSINSDRVRSAARQFQSFVAGARDKALYANEVRGVRLLLDPNDNHAVSGMQYVGAPQRETGSLTYNLLGSGVAAPYDASGRTVFLAANTGTSWASLYRRGFLAVGNRIQIPSGTGKWCTISAITFPSSGASYQDLTLTLNAPNPDLATSMASWTFSLELEAGVLGDAQPVLFPRGVVIDLDGSQVPQNWMPSSAPQVLFPLQDPNSSYLPKMDILFTPRGTVVGDATSMGMLHFHFADAYDVGRWHSSAPAGTTIGTPYFAYRTYGSTTSTPPPYPYASPNCFTSSNPKPSTGYIWPVVPADASGTTNANLVVTRDRILATLAVKTGNVSVHYVNTTYPSASTAVANSVAQDPFYFAETGQVANK